MTLCQTQKIRLLHRFVLEIKLIKNPAIWLVISNSVQITGARFLLNMRFAQEYSKYNFHLEKNKNPFFVPIFRTKAFFKKSSSVTHNFTWVSSTMPKFRKKMNEPILREHLDKRRDGRTDGRMVEQTGSIFKKFS